MPTSIKTCVDETMLLMRVADAAGVSLAAARSVLAQLALLDRADGDRLLADARREQIRILADLRRRRTR